MPTYDYVCAKCNHEFEAFQSITDAPLKKCPECGGKVKRRIGAGSGLIFKGSGFYITDYKKKSAAGPSGSDSTGSADSGTKPKNSDTSAKNKT
ncbi:zinc ribbon domain-containing protein [bacterium]|nr:zinc ribbon domain-containing protein [bacterium]